MTVEIRQAGGEWLVEVRGEPIGRADSELEAQALGEFWRGRLNVHRAVARSALASTTRSAGITHTLASGEQRLGLLFGRGPRCAQPQKPLLCSRTGLPTRLGMNMLCAAYALLIIKQLMKRWWDLLASLPDLRGFNLARWCRLPENGELDVCHAAVLLRLANGWSGVAVDTERLAVLKA